MPFDHLEPYATDVEHYRGPMDRVSPYHYYQFTYYALRGYWRRVLYAWTRREPCDATAAVAPQRAVAGVPTRLAVTVAVGGTALPAGGRLAIYCSKDFGGVANSCVGRLFHGPDGQAGYGSRIDAVPSRSDVELRVRVHSTGAVFTCVEVFVEKGELVEGDTVDVVFGIDPSKPQMVCEKAKTLPFRIAVDHRGDGEFRPVQRYPSVTVVGNRAAYLRCFAPPTPAAGDRMPVLVVAADLENHNPAYHHSGKLTVQPLGKTERPPMSVAMPADAHGSVRVDGVPVTEQGVTRIRVIDETNGLMGQTNPVCPDMAPAGLKLYFGEIHSHTDLSDGTGTPEDNFRWARDVEGLDFAALADHFEDGQSYNYTLEEKWRRTRETVSAFHEPGRFVTLLGYEIGTLEAHRNVYFRDDEGRMVVQGPGGETVTMDNVFDKLAGTDYLLIPHAPKFHGINWDRPHCPDRQRLVEICSLWGISEEGGGGRYQSVRHALDAGYQFGFTGGTDNHFAEPGNPNAGGITGVFAAELTREAVFDALRARHTFATSGPRMTLRFETQGGMMGDEVSLAGGRRARFRARALACTAIERLEIIRNGIVAHTLPVGDTADARLDWEDDQPVEKVVHERERSEIPVAYYYLRVTTSTGDYGWSSPIWISAAG